MTRRDLERNRCDGCGRFHQDLSYFESADGESKYDGLSLCDACVTREAKAENARENQRVVDAHPAFAAFSQETRNVIARNA